MPKSNNSKEPAKLSIDQFLNSKSVYSLQRLLSFWSRKEQPWYSKMELIRELRSLMLDKEVVQKRLQSLKPASQSLLRNIIKGTSSDLRIGEQLAFYDDLEKAGLIDRFLSVQRFQVLERNPQVVIPEDLKPILTAALEIDTRPLPEIISLSAFLHSLPPQPYEALVAPLLQSAERDGSREKDYRLLIDPKQVRGRLAKLPNVMQEMLLLGISRNGGIIELKAPASRSVSETRSKLEKLLLGTVTELPVYFLNHPMGLVFTDVSRAMLSTATAAPVKIEGRIERASVALGEMNSMLGQLATEGARVKQDGEIYRSSIRRLASSIDEAAFNGDVEDLAEEYMALMARMHLLHERDGELVPTEQAGKWFLMPPEEQLHAIIDTVPSMLHGMVPHIWDTLLNELSSLPTGKHTYAGEMMACLILTLLNEIAANPQAAESLEACGSMDGLRHKVVLWLHVLSYYGLADTFYSQELHEVRLTELGAAVLGRKLPPCPPEHEKIVIVNPDFELIVFRHGPAWRVVNVLSKFATHRKADQTYHYRITPKDVQSAVLFGMTADDMLSFLAAHSRTAIPQNVEYSLRDWAAKVHVTHSFHAIVLEAREPHTLDVMMEDALVKPHILRRLSPTVAVLKTRITTKRVLNHLRENGIFLKS